MSTQIELLKKYSLPVRGVSGQHLLIDPNIQRKIVDLLELKPKDRVLEIGPGLGALTGEILRRGKAKVWAIEKDARFVEVLEREFASHLGRDLNVIHGDILKWDLEKFIRHPEGPFARHSEPRRGEESLRPFASLRVTGRVGGLRMTRTFKVISNIPYYITAPILFHLFSFHSRISLAVLTMQKEVAARLLASPGSKDYGRLTLAVRYHADVEHAFDISPGCFTPRPEVDSSVVILHFHPPSQLPRGVSEDFFFRLIQTAFSQRRKTLLHLLSKNGPVKISRGDLTALFSKLGLPITVRGEELLLKDYLALASGLTPFAVAC